jgi:hypothetical protein
MLQEFHQPVTIDLIKEALDIGVQDPIHSLFRDRIRQRIERVVLTAIRSEAIAETEEVRFVDTLEYGANRTLDDFVFQRADSQGSLPTIRLRNVNTSRGIRSKGSAVNPTMKIRKAVLQVRFVFTPCHSVHTSRCILLEVVKAGCKQLHADVVEKGRESKIATLLSRFAHTE